ncbi:glycosyltransferase family 2 protein [Novosphingobium profundi]|nr:glycosyltransferase family 2 protein [Novosphingobium profundi]
MSATFRLSIVIANYNYGRFLARAITSALDVDWPDLEVVIVDDGSTDHSRDIIDSFAGRVTAHFQENRGQVEANNAGFARSTGSLVIFLDADDVLQPEIAREIAKVWRKGVSKVQVLMEKVDENERPLNAILPHIRSVPSAEAIRKWAHRTGEYPSPPGSGNAYARSFLDRIFPLDTSRDSSTDTTCIAMAPFLGDVVTIAKPLVLYRIHGANDSNMLAKVDTFGREVERARKRLKASQDACEMEGFPPPDAGSLRRGNHLLQLRAASLRLQPATHPLADDSRLTVLNDAVRLPFQDSFEPLVRRIAIAGYSALVALLPMAAVRPMVRMRFSSR